MSHKINPISFRLGNFQDWMSRWFSAVKYREYLKIDQHLRSILGRLLKDMHISKVEIERSANELYFIISTSRPGLIIGRGGSGIEDLKKKLEIELMKMMQHKKQKLNIKIDIKEVLRTEVHASLVAQDIADQIEKRIPFRRAMKQAIEKVMQTKEALGVKIRISGRLGGSEIARDEWLAKGKMPLQTLRSNIDYAHKNAYCTYGTIGVKVWIYKGELLGKEKQNS